MAESNGEESGGDVVPLVRPQCVDQQYNMLLGEDGGHGYLEGLHDDGMVPVVLVGGWGAIISLVAGIVSGIRLGRSSILGVCEVGDALSNLEEAAFCL